VLLLNSDLFLSLGLGRLWHLKLNLRSSGCILCSQWLSVHLWLTRYIYVHLYAGKMYSLISNHCKGLNLSVLHHYYCMLFRQMCQYYQITRPYIPEDTTLHRYWFSYVLNDHIFCFFLCYLLLLLLLLLFLLSWSNIDKTCNH
jgi:hypothetical protein